MLTIRESYLNSAEMVRVPAALRARPFEVIFSELEMSKTQAATARALGDSMKSCYPNANPNQLDMEGLALPPRELGPIIAL